MHSVVPALAAAIKGVMLPLVASRARDVIEAITAGFRILWGACLFGIDHSIIGHTETRHAYLLPARAFNSFSPVVFARQIGDILTRLQNNFLLDRKSVV